MVLELQDCLNEDEDKMSIIIASDCKVLVVCNNCDERNNLHNSPRQRTRFEKHPDEPGNSMPMPGLCDIMMEYV